MTFKEIFAEYYTIFRGQAVSIPVEGDREYVLGLNLANSAVKKWDRADGQLWRELWTTAAIDGTADLLVFDGSEYAAPKNMRKPPAFVKVANRRLPVIQPHEAQNYSDLSAFAYFTGSANIGYIMHTNVTPIGLDIDYPYLKKPTMMKNDKSVPDMSDPNFMVQYMLSQRYANERNGFGFRSAKMEADNALQNMKIENNTGTYGNSANLGNSGAGWGVGNSGSII